LNASKIKSQSRVYPSLQE